MNNYTERLELPEGQWAVLLTRLPADRAQMVRVGIAREQDMRKKSLRVGDPVFVVSVRDAVLWECSVKNYLTDELVNDISKADPRVSDAVELKALELYATWYAEAYGGPKEPSPTDASTPNGEKDTTSETSEPHS